MRLLLKKYLLPSVVILAAGFVSLSPLCVVNASSLQKSGKPQNVTLLIYPHDLGLVHDNREVLLEEGDNVLLLEGVPSKLIEDSLLVSTPETLSLRFKEFDFRSDSLGFRTLLEKSIGEVVFVLQDGRPDSPKLSGFLMGVEGDEALVKFENQIECVPIKRISFQKLPPDLAPRPSLYLRLTSPQAQSVPLDLTYLTKGLSWRTSYTVEVDIRKNKASMMGWVVITNMSGADFENAQVQLASQLASKLTSQLTSGLERLPTKVGGAAGERMLPSRGANSPYIYPLVKETFLRNATNKKISFLASTGVAAEKEYRIELPIHTVENREEARVSLPIQIWFAIRNIRDNGIGFPLPPGKAKVYARDSGKAIYVGPVDVRHTRVGDAIHVPIDTCNIVDAQIQQTDFKQLGSLITETAFRVILTNKNAREIRLMVVQKLPPDTTLVRSFPEECEIAEGKVSWPVTVPVNQTISLRYRLRTVHAKSLPSGGPA